MPTRFVQAAKHVYIKLTAEPREETNLTKLLFEIIQLNNLQPSPVSLVSGLFFIPFAIFSFVQNVSPKLQWMALCLCISSQCGNQTLLLNAK